jgi:hypothetical protein
MTALEIVVTKLGDNTNPALCKLATEEVEQAIKNYCNIDKVPDELKFVWANMAIDLIRYEKAVKGNDTEDISIADVASISMGDTSINLGGGGANSAKKSHIPNLDQIVMNNKAQLNRYRRMVW